MKLHRPVIVFAGWSDQYEIDFPTDLTNLQTAASVYYHFIDFKSNLTKTYHYHGFDLCTLGQS